MAQINVGDSEARVIQVMGPPDGIDTIPEHLWCSSPGTTHEFMYGTSVVASWDVTGFNQAGVVTCKVNLQSP